VIPKVGMLRGANGGGVYVDGISTLSSVRVAELGCVIKKTELDFGFISQYLLDG